MKTGVRTSSRGFTLMEIMATLLLLTFGLASVIGMVLYAQRLSSEYQDQATAMATAESVAWDPALVGNPSAAQSGLEGSLNGYYVYRNETPVTDEVDAEHQWVMVTVHVYAGEADRYLTSVRRRLLRRTVAP